MTCICLATVSGISATGLWSQPQGPARHRSLPLLPDPSPRSIVILGTSLSSRGTWQTSVEAALNACAELPLRIHTVARGGAGSAWGRSQVAAVLAGRPDVVLIEFSTNDADIRRLTTPAMARANLAAIVTGLRAGEGPPPAIYLMTMNPLFGARAALRPALSRYVRDYHLLADQLDLGLIDITPAWQATLTPQNRRDLIPDGAHPTAETAREITAPAITAALAPQINGCGIGSEDAAQPGRAAR